MNEHESCRTRAASGRRFSARDYPSDTPSGAGLPDSVFLRHLEENRRVRQLRDVLVIGDPVVAQMIRGTEVSTSLAPNVVCCNPSCS